MSSQLFRRGRLLSLTDMFISSCSILFFLAAMWILATDIYRGEGFMVIGSIGALICAALKSFGFWTCYKFIIVMNKYKQTGEQKEVKQLAIEVTTTWLAAKKILLVVPALTLLFYTIAYWDCWICMGVGVGWIAFEVTLIYYGGLFVTQLRKLIEVSEQKVNQPLVYQLSAREYSV